VRRPSPRRAGIAEQRAVSGGADGATLQVVEVEDLPLAYLARQLAPVACASSATSPSPAGPNRSETSTRSSAGGAGPGRGSRGYATGSVTTRPNRSSSSCGRDSGVPLGGAGATGTRPRSSTAATWRGRRHLFAGRSSV